MFFLVPFILIKIFHINDILMIGLYYLTDLIKNYSIFLNSHIKFFAVFSQENFLTYLIQSFINLSFRVLSLSILNILFAIFSGDLGSTNISLYGTNSDIGS